MPALVPPSVVTSTLAVPVAAAGVVAIIVEALITVNALTGDPPTVTLLAPQRFAPVIVMVVPPASGPIAGLMDVTAGASR